MSTSSQSKKVPGIVWLTKHWGFKYNPFPSSGVAVLGGDQRKDNGLLFQPEVQKEKVEEAVEKFVVGAAFSGLKFGYLWSLGGGIAGDQRGFGKSSLLQYLVQQVNTDTGQRFLIQSGLDEEDAESHPLCATIASFDMANARSLAAVFFEATRYACRFRIGDGPTLAARLHERMVARLGNSDPDVLAAAVYAVNDDIRGRTIGPPIEDLVGLLCAGDQNRLGRFIEDVKTGSRGRIQAANYLATFLLFAKAAGVPHVLLGCDQLEDFAATTTTRQKRSLETERFRDFVLELQPMADMLTVVVTLHPRAEQAIGEMWKLADLPSFAFDRIENDAQVVVLEQLEDPERARALLQPYLEDARKKPPLNGAFAPFNDDAIEIILSRSDGKPRDLLRKACALIEHGCRENWEEIDGRRAASVLDSLAGSDDDLNVPVPRAPIEEQWT